MQTPELVFVIPTYRLRDVCETVEKYDENFWNNGHSVRLIVFDDSTVANHEKYYPLLEQTETHNDLYYVGPKEKEQFIRVLNARLGDRKLDSVVRNLFRPSYGGNRNFTLMYTLGSLMVSADDDMRPHALIEDSPESLVGDEISRGRLLKATQNGYTPRSFDILAAFKDVLGKKVSEVPRNYEKGELLLDTAMDLETNASKGLARENSLLLQRGPVSRAATVKMAQTFRSGTNDIDAVDYVDLFLGDEEQTNPDDLNDLYVLVNFRPAVTNKNWRMDCGVAGYDNTVGLPPFFPTRLRFEDYIYRLWIQQKGIVAAHVDAVQTHIKNNYMRNPLAAEVFNEEVSNLLKRKIKAGCRRQHDLGIEFDYEGEVTAQDSEEILAKIRALHTRAHKALGAAPRCRRASSEPAPRTPSAPDDAWEERRRALELFSYNLEKAFYGFEPDFFQHNLSRIVDDVISQIKGSIELWPTLVEICFFHKHKKALPQTKVKNRKKG